MDCANIQRHLSEYMDGVLDAQTQDRVEKHLSSCKECREELESLKALIHDLENLPRVKAPDDFLEQLHERMNARFNFRDYIKGLSRIFQMRIPLQIAAATAMAVLIFAIVYSPRIGERVPNMPVNQVHEALEKQEKETMTASAPMEIKAEMPSEPAAQPAGGKDLDLKKQEVSVAEERLAAKRTEPILEKPQSQLKRAVQPPVPTVAAAKPVPQISSPKETQKVELALLLKRTDMEEVRGRSYNMASNAAPSAPEKTKAGSLNAADAEKLGGVTLKDKKEVDYLKEDKAIQEVDTEESSPGDETDTWVLSPYEARKQVEALIAKIQGRILKVETRNNTDQPIYIDAEIPANQYIYFYGELHQVGTVQSPLPSISEQGQNPIQIRIRFVVE